MRGAWTREAGVGVRRKVLNLSRFRPDVFPQPTTFFAISTVGMLITHSFVDFRVLKVKSRSLTTQPMRGGSKSIIVCHDMAITLVRLWRTVVSKTTGPGSSRRYTSDKGKDRLTMCDHQQG